MRRLLSAVVLLAVAACGTRTEIWTSGPGPLDGSADVERRCPTSRPRLDSACSPGEPPFACDFEGERCADGTRSTRVYSCYAGSKGASWFYGNTRGCSCPDTLPLEGEACDGPTRSQGDCKYYAGECGSSCSCVGARWSCQSACASKGGGCPTVRPSSFLPCAPAGLECVYPEASCATTVACAPREGALAGADGVWVTVARATTCDAR
jgi:hypothetical protein